jgi:HEAT repeat protein
MHSSQDTIRLALLIWIAAGLLALAFGVAGCGSDEGSEAPPPPSAGSGEAEEDAELAAVADALKSSDPEERSAALFDVEPEGRGVQVLLGVLNDDPDPEVRGLAARQLGHASSPEATAGLVSALDDPDPGVLIEAINALELIDDSTVIGSLEKLLQHPDAQVREAAKDAIEFLKD